MATTDANSSIALGAALATSLYKLNGAGLKIGIISDSYNNKGGAAADVQSGDLPANVTVVRDLASGGSDEGRAMLELAYKIAPGATYYVSSGFSDPGSTTPSIQACATAVAALQAAGCNVIIDDLGFTTAEGFYQTGTVLDQAITTAVNAGVDYFSAAGNDGKNFYENGFKALSTAIAGIGNGHVTANDFGGGNPFLSVTIATGRTTQILFEWAQPFASIGTSGNSAGNSLALYLLDASGAVVASSTINQVGGDPVQAFAFTNNTASSAFRIVVVQNGGTVPNGQLFKVVPTSTSITFNDPNANKGSGGIYGHELLAIQNTVAAVNYAQTPAFGVSPPPVVSFSSVGPGRLLFDSQGNALATPVNTAEPNFAAAQGTNTAVPGFAPFNGTSAAAPNAGAVAALLLQGNRALSTTQVTALLAQSAIPTSTTLPDAGAGLIQARAGVELAVAAGGSRWSNAAGGDWSNAANWTTGAPNSAQSAMVGTNLGAFSGSYTAAVTTTGQVAGSLTVSAPSGSTAAVMIAAGGGLTVGGSNAANPTANDLLVATGGTLGLSGGSLSVAGSLNVNNGAVAETTGSVTADNYAMNAGSFTLGDGGTGTATFGLSGGGWSEIGGTASVTGQGAVTTTTLSVSASSFQLKGAAASVTASGAASFTNAFFDDAGSFLTSGALSLESTNATVLNAASLSAASIAIGSSNSAGSFSIAGVVNDAGGLTNLANARGVVTLQSTGQLTVGGALDNPFSINFAGAGGKLVFTTTNSTTLQNNLFAKISGFNNGVSSVDLTGIGYDPTLAYQYNATSGQFDLNSATGTNLATLLFNAADGYTSNSFKLAPDTNSKVLVTACYCQGTRILTDRGEVAVEALTIGDCVVTAAGMIKPIRWIGQRSYAGRFLMGKPRLLPILLRAGCLGEGLPRRDLRISPAHAMFIDGVLFPASSLVNGTTIVQERDCSCVDYFHVELDRHDVIIAEGAPSETFLDDDSRRMFHNAHEFDALYPDQPAASGYCARRLECGPELEQVRSRLAQLAASRWNERAA